MDHYQDEIADNDSSRKPDPIDVHVGANLRRIRLSRMITQRQLAEMMGITFQQIQKYERGTNRIGASRIVKLLRALEINIENLFTGTGVTAQGPNKFIAPLSLKAMELANMHDAISDPKQRSALRLMARAMAQAED